MWSGHQSPGGDHHPSDPPQPRQGQPNPYQQGPDPYQQEQQSHGRPEQVPWAMPTVPSGSPAQQPPPAPGGGGKSAVIAVIAATAVVIATGVTGFLLLGKDGDDGKEASPGPAASTSASASPADGARGADGPVPVVPGWKVVVNPKRGIAFDVPVQWSLKAVDWASYVAEDSDPEETPLVGFSAPAMLKEKWCRSDEDKNGTEENTPLATAGSRGESEARSTEEAARNNAELWVYGGYAQPDRDRVTTGAARPYTTKSGISGSVATATSSGAVRTGRCDNDGKATAFAFRNAKGEIVSWTFVGVRGVGDEVPESTVRKILGTVRLMGDAS
ncbi:hypothetical protein [Streptomyces sp. NPDC060054]|uniref:hypothetical protein n=1 Tax=unclassified Streptomyces TaxID=2593676 RepID=UPI00093FAB1B|nr:hypothetical protein [Streptomyces sp. TSRI0281]OKI43042.1 hypothetical protein A6A29_06585 [Streptomyces sp. TSRI0281]